jgi:D-amino peptidase
MRYLFLLLGLVGLGGAQPKNLRIFISVDMEGVAGVVTGDQLGPGGFEYPRFREFMTREALAAIDGARQAGATQFVVADSHGNGENLLIEMFPKDVTIVRSWPRPLMMMQGVDSSFDGAFCLGYHAGAASLKGVRAHTISSARFSGVFLHGQPVSELGLSAAIAGEFGVPVLLVSGDDAVAAEASQLLAGVETAPVKWALSFHAARTMTPEAAQEMIRKKAFEAVQKRGKRKPHVVQTPVDVDVRFQSYRPAEVLELLPIFGRVEARTIRFRAKTIAEMSRFLMFVNHFETGLQP